MEIGTLEDVGVSVRVLGILCKIAMQSLEAETVNQMCLVALFLQAVIYPLEAERTNGIEESGCTAPLMSSMDFTEI